MKTSLLTQQDIVTVRIHADELNTTDPVIARRRVTHEAFKRVDDTYGVRPWRSKITPPAPNDTDPYWTVTFTPITRDELPGIPRFGR